MRIRHIINEASETQQLFKGITTATGYDRWVSKTGELMVPGFLAGLGMAKTYSEPSLTGEPDEPSMIISVEISRDEVEDFTEEFRSWVDENSEEEDPTYDVSLGFPDEWRSRIWTVKDSGSAHEAGLSCFYYSDFVYCGQSKPFSIVKKFKNQLDWGAKEGI